MVWTQGIGFSAHGEKQQVCLYARIRRGNPMKYPG